LKGKVVPVLCGASARNRGVQPLLDAIVDYLPSPIDVPPVKAVTLSDDEIEVVSDEKEPFSALAFKLQIDPFVGRLTYVRVYSGRLNKGS